MTYPTWLPRRADARGILVALALALLAELLEFVVPTYNALASDIVIATVLGTVIGNTGLRRFVGHSRVGEPEGSANAGLRYVSTWVVRLAVILLGLKLRARFFRGENLAVIAAVALVSIPGAFFVAHLAGRAFGLRRPLVDALAGGTMICGASAVGAIGPVVGAKQEEQSVAIATVFLYSMTAMLTFHPIARAIHLSAVDSGLWAGLAVNDFASALTVGRMFDIESDGGSVMAAMSKSMRVLLLVPTVLFFQWLRRPAAATGASAGNTASVPKTGFAVLLPGYLLGYLALGIVRTVGDRLLPESNIWHRVLIVDSHLAALAMAMMAASLGLHLDFRRLLGTSARAVMVGASASVWTTGITLFLLVSAANGRRGFGAIVGLACLALTALLYRVLVARRPDSAESFELTPFVPPSKVAKPATPLVPTAPDAASRAGNLRVILIPVGVAALIAALFAVTHMAPPAPPAPIAVLVTPTTPGAVCPDGMAIVPAGDFELGSREGYDPDETPVRTRHVDALCLGLHEITVREYSACVAAGGCTPGRRTADWPNLSWWEGRQWTRYCNDDSPERQNHPMNCVDWYQANAYCHVTGGRLPTEVEWEYTARGGEEHRRFPWGDGRPDCTRANCCGTECVPLILTVRKEWCALYPEDDGFPSTAPVGSFPEGAGRWGHLDFSGNVTEWTASHYCPYDAPDCDSDERVVRGDGFQTNLLKKLRAARRNHDEPWHRSPDAGFRCARTLAP